MEINKNKNIITLIDNKKELTIEKTTNDIISFSFFNTDINNNLGKSIEFVKTDKEEEEIAYHCIQTLFDELKKEYLNYKDYFDKVYDNFIDINGNKKNIPIYNKKHDSFIFYSDNGDFNNNSYIRIFKIQNKYYMYFNKPSMDFIIKEDESKFNYNSFYKYFNNYFNNLMTIKRNKTYGKLKNFNNFI